MRLVKLHALGEQRLLNVSSGANSHSARKALKILKMACKFRRKLVLALKHITMLNKGGAKIAERIAKSRPRPEDARRAVAGDEVTIAGFNLN